MLWRVRTTMPDRPGALARLARSCGERGANILALQIFPGVHGVTDELTGTEQALVDGPTRFLDAVRRVA